MKELNEQHKIITACLLCGAITGTLVFVITYLWGPSWPQRASVAVGLGIGLISLLVMLIVVGAMFGKDWFDN